MFKVLFLSLFYLFNACSQNLIIMTKPVINADIVPFTFAKLVSEKYVESNLYSFHQQIHVSSFVGGSIFTRCLYCKDIFNGSIRGSK
jgi:hypothetical protein